MRTIRKKEASKGSELYPGAPALATARHDPRRIHCCTKVREGTVWLHYHGARLIGRPSHFSPAETMKPSHAIAAAVLLAACAPAMQSATAPAAQRSFVGVWTGMGTQSDQPDSSWSIGD